MSTSEQAASALRKSVRDNSEQMALTDESRRLLADLLEDRMRIAVAEGITAAMTDANASMFVRAMFAEAQRMAAEKSVEVAGGVLKALVMRAITFTVLGWLVYALGGWTALAGYVKFTKGG